MYSDSGNWEFPRKTRLECYLEQASVNPCGSLRHRDGQRCAFVGERTEQDGERLTVVGEDVEMKHTRHRKDDWVPEVHSTRVVHR